jgi:hypothetical protein
MNKLDLHPQSETGNPEVLTSENDSVNTRLENACRLIVLIPVDSDYNAATRRVWELATATANRVLFLGLCRDRAQEPSLRRQLVTISALVGDGRVRTELKVEIGTDWVEAVKRNYQAGDMIVCFAEQRAGVWHRPLSQILQSNFKASVYLLSGLPPQRLPRSNWLSQTIAWSGSVGIIVGSFLLQIRITALPQDWAQMTLLILSVIFETWLIWVWNSLL